MLLVPENLLAGLATEAEVGYPEEICGFVVGRVENNQKRATWLVAVVNDWEKLARADKSPAFVSFLAGTRRERFYLPPDEYCRVEREARLNGEAILGFYHSHPDSPAIPSEYDLLLAQGTIPGYSYIIQSVKSGMAAEIASFVLRDDFSRFDEEPVRRVTGERFAGEESA